MVTLAGHWVLPYSDTDIKTSIFCSSSNYIYKVNLKPQWYLCFTFMFSFYSTSCHLQNWKETRWALLYYLFPQLLSRRWTQWDKCDITTKDSTLQPHCGDSGGMPIFHHLGLGEDWQWNHWCLLAEFLLQQPNKKLNEIETLWWLTYNTPMVVLAVFYHDSVGHVLILSSSSQSTKSSPLLKAQMENRFLSWLQTRLTLP